MPRRIDVVKFPPPYAHRAANPDAFSFMWMKLHYVFNLPDPYAFPTVDGFAEDERRELARYVANCAELAESSLLSHVGSLTIKYSSDDGVVDVTHDSTAKDALRGASVLFRLVAAESETGGFGRTRRIIERRVATSETPPVADALVVTKTWRAARGKLSARMLDNIANEKMFEDGIGGFPADTMNAGSSPTQLISMFDYGDLIHQGRQLEAFEKSREDPHGHSRAEFEHVGALLQLSHFYLGYAVLTESALGRTPEQRL
ncbi:hypothetical protein [Cellulomonas cellasea]|uniref:Uncharacterized protein n=1 Tax=Cellulomonas cellasea TaxID=43670 RepID=A0A7W4UGJ8_9CELL|nr:hypothetical protein [Cellulomonas cellasea]MBB2923759.1 hypothetical protein [Cellulomonas cellasea]